MDPTLDKLYAALDQADAAGEEQDAQDIAALIREHKAKRTTQPQQPGQQPAQRAPVKQPNLDMTPVRREGQQENNDANILRGLDRLPNLVGLGNVSTGFTKADLNPLDAVGRFATGAAVAPVAATVAAGDAFTLGGATRLAGMLPGSSYEKAKAAKEQIMQAAPGSAQLLGDFAGYGLGGTALAKIPGSIAGLTTKGMGVQGGLMAGGSALMEDPTDIPTALLETGIGVVGGKALQGLGNTVVKPLAEKYVPKIERALTGKKGRAEDGFDIPEDLVQRVANRTKMPTSEIRQNLADYAAIHGPDSPRFLSLVDAKTAGEFRTLSKAKSEANAVFRAGEEEAALARPDVVGRAVGRTGDTKSATAATEEVIAQGDEAIAATTAKADDIERRLIERLTQQTRALDDTAEAQTRAVADKTAAQSQRLADDAAARKSGIVDMTTEKTQALALQGDQTKRMIRNETDKLVAAERSKLKASATRLSTALQQRTAGVKTDAEVEQALKEHTDNVMGKMRNVEVEVPREALPVDPTLASKALLTYAKGVTDKAEYKVVTELAEAMGKDGPIKLTIGKADVLRRVFNDANFEDAKTFPLRKAAMALRDAVGAKYPAYKDEYLDVFADTQRLLEARGLGAKALGAKAGEAADDIALMKDKTRVAGSDEGAATRMAIQQGARDAALREIAGTTKDGAQALTAAVSILRNADAIERLAGKEGEALVKTVRTAMENVKKIQREIAQIKEAKVTTREGVTDSIKAQTRAAKREGRAAIRDVDSRTTEAQRVLKEDATTATRRIADRKEDIKRELTDVQKERLQKLERVAKAQLDIIKQAMAKNTRAIDAASRVMSMTESELAAATAGSTARLDDVARGAIQGRAQQSPTDAIKTVEDLATPSQGRKITSVAGKQTGDTLQKLGETQRREIANLNAVAARKVDDDVVGEELSLAMEASAALLGRAGPGYQTAILKRGANSLGSLGVSNKAAKAIAEAVMRQDKAYVEKLINRLAKTERQRKVMAEAIRAWVVGSVTGAVEDVR